MILTEQHIVKSEEWRPWCVKAKNLYNQALYYWRQSMFKKIEYFSEYELIGLFREFDEETFRALPSHCGQEVITGLFNNAKSWQRSRAEWQKSPSKFLGRPKLPKYKKELSILSFTPNQVKLKNGFIHFPKMIGISPMKTNIPNIKSCRVIPKSNHFVVEFTYEVQEKPLKSDNGKAMGVDLGLSNLAACFSNTDRSIVINGKPLKSINQFYNKRKAQLQSKLKEKTHTSKRIERLTFRRNQKIKNYIHHASKFIIEEAKTQDITKIVIGNNINWKQEISIGKRNNQNFVSIPHATLIEKVKYKAKLEGIDFQETEESYTSKCSFLDMEKIGKSENYVGRRTKRGLFRTSKNLYINADCNGAGNILRKVIGDFKVNDSIVRAVVAPSKIRIFEQNILKPKTFINNF
jgi:putative transposase